MEAQKQTDRDAAKGGESVNEQGHLTLVDTKPADSRVEVTIEQLEHLLDEIKLGHTDVAIMWLTAAIRQAKKDIREGKGVGPS
jgi:hypothetical protein